jgi:hypothetical protein
MWSVENNYRDVETIRHKEVWFTGLNTTAKGCSLSTTQRGVPGYSPYPWYVLPYTESPPSEVSYYY